MSPIEHETEQWEGRKGSRYGIRWYGQGRIKRKCIVVAGIKKHMENVLCQFLEFQAPNGVSELFLNVRRRPNFYFWQEG